MAGVILHLLPQLPVFLTFPFILEQWAEPLVTQELHFHQCGSKMKKQTDVRCAPITADLTAHCSEIVFF